MAQFRITTKAKGYTGQRAGVNFADGQATVDSETQSAALRYFRSAAGYGVEPVDDPADVDAAAAEGSAEDTNPDTGDQDTGDQGGNTDPADVQEAPKAPAPKQPAPRQPAAPKAPAKTPAKG